MFLSLFSLPPFLSLKINDFFFNEVREVRAEIEDQIVNDLVSWDFDFYSE